MTVTTPLTPPRVALWGLEHLDVVVHADLGWTGTVHHDRRALGRAEVRWHASFAADELDVVAARLVVTARRSAPRPPRAAPARVVEPPPGVLARARRAAGAPARTARRVEDWWARKDLWLGA